MMISREGRIKRDREAVSGLREVKRGKGGC
jgi:hypothetical protein